MKSPLVLRALSACLLCIYFITQHLNFSIAGVVEIRKPAPLRPSSPGNFKEIIIPNSLGSIEEKSNGAAYPIFLIQDAHAIPDAQKNIRKLIQYFKTHYGVQEVLVEGAAGPLDAQIFRSFPDPGKLSKTLDVFARQGELPGSVQAALLDPRALKFQGMEDWKLYEAGMGFYLKAFSQSKILIRELESAEEKLEKQKKEIYPKKLLGVDRILGRYRKNKTSWIETLKSLSGYQKPEAGSSLELVQKVFAQKNSGSIETEVTRLAESVRLKLEAHPDKAALGKFHQKLQQFKTSQITPQDFALYLKPFLLRLKISENFPGFSAELKERMLLEDKIKNLKGTKLFEKFEVYVKNLKEPLFENQAQRDLDEQGERTQLLKEAARLELSRSQWKLFREMPPRDIQNLGLDPELFQDHHHFYRNAEKREDAFLGHLQKKNAFGVSSKIPRLMVLGGFHAQGMIQRLKTAGLDYMLITPHIKNLPKENFYHRQMQGQSSWSGYLNPGRDGRVNLYEAFIRQTRDGLLEISREPSVLSFEGKQDLPLMTQDTRLLKSWRDQIIRDLANQQKIAKAGQYTRYLDEVTRSGSSPRKEDWILRAEKFMAELRKLESMKQLNEQNVFRLLNPSTILSKVAAPHMLAHGNALPADFYTPRKWESGIQIKGQDQAARLEARAAIKPEHLAETLLAQVNIGKPAGEIVKELSARILEVPVEKKSAVIKQLRRVLVSSQVRGKARVIAAKLLDSILSKFARGVDLNGIVEEIWYTAWRLLGTLDEIANNVRQKTPEEGVFVWYALSLLDKIGEKIPEPQAPLEGEKIPGWKEIEKRLDKIGNRADNPIFWFQNPFRGWWQLEDELDDARALAAGLADLRGQVASLLGRSREMFHPGKQVSGESAKSYLLRLQTLHGQFKALAEQARMLEIFEMEALQKGRQNQDSIEKIFWGINLEILSYDKLTADTRPLLEGPKAKSLQEHLTALRWEEPAELKKLSRQQAPAAALSESKDQHPDFFEFETLFSRISFIHDQAWQMSKWAKAGGNLDRGFALRKLRGMLREPFRESRESMLAVYERLLEFMAAKPELSFLEKFWRGILEFLAGFHLIKLSKSDEDRMQELETRIRETGKKAFELETWIEDLRKLTGRYPVQAPYESLQEFDLMPEGALAPPPERPRAAMPVSSEPEEEIKLMQEGAVTPQSEKPKPQEPVSVDPEEEIKLMPEGAVTLQPEKKPDPESLPEPEEGYRLAAEEPPPSGISADYWKSLLDHKIPDEDKPKDSGDQDKKDQGPRQELRVLDPVLGYEIEAFQGDLLSRLRGAGMTIGQRALEIRKDRGYETRSQLVQASGIPSNTLKHIEESDSVPLPSNLQKLSKTLKADPLWILKGYGIESLENENLGRRLELLRLRRAWTLEQFVAELEKNGYVFPLGGVSAKKDQIHQWEKGHLIPPREFWDLFIKLFGYPELFKGVQEASRDEAEQLPLPQELTARLPEMSQHERVTLEASSGKLTMEQSWEKIQQEEGYQGISFHTLRNDMALDPGTESRKKLGEHPKFESKTQQVVLRREKLYSVLETSSSEMTEHQVWEKMKQIKGYENLTFRAVHNDFTWDRGTETRGKLSEHTRYKKTVSFEAVAKRREMLYQVLEASPKKFTARQLWKKARLEKGYKDLAVKAVRSDIQNDLGNETRGKLGEHPNLKIKKRPSYQRAILAREFDREEVAQRRQKLYEILEVSDDLLSVKKLWEKIRQEEGYQNLKSQAVWDDVSRDSGTETRGKLSKHPKLYDLQGETGRARRRMLYRILQGFPEKLTLEQLWEKATQRKGYKGLLYQVVAYDIDFDRGSKARGKLGEHPNLMLKNKDIADRRQMLYGILKKSSIELSVTDLWQRAKRKKGYQNLNLQIVWNDIDQDPGTRIRGRLAEHPKLSINRHPRRRDKTAKLETSQRRQMLYGILEEAPEKINEVQLWESAKQISGYEKLKLETVRDDVFLDSGTEIRRKLNEHPNLMRKEPDSEEVVKRRDVLYEILKESKYLLKVADLLSKLQRVEGYRNMDLETVKNDIWNDLGTEVRGRLKDHEKLRNKQVAVHKRREMLYQILERSQERLTVKQLWERARNAAGYRGITLSNVAGDVKSDLGSVGRVKLGDHPKLKTSRRPELRTALSDQAAKIFLKHFQKSQMERSELRKAVQVTVQVGAGPVNQSLEDLIHEVSEQDFSDMNTESIKDELLRMKQKLQESGIPEAGYTVGYELPEADDPHAVRDFVEAVSSLGLIKEVKIQKDKDQKIPDELVQQLRERGIRVAIEDLSKSGVIFSGAQEYAGLVTDTEVSPASSKMIPVILLQDQGVENTLLSKAAILLQTGVALLLAHEISDKTARAKYLTQPELLLEKYGLFTGFQGTILKAENGRFKISAMALHLYLDWTAQQSLQSAA